MNTCTDPYPRNMNDFDCMNIGSGRTKCVYVMKCKDDDLVRVV